MTPLQLTSSAPTVTETGFTGIPLPVKGTQQGRTYSKSWLYAWKPKKQIESGYFYRQDQQVESNNIGAKVLSARLPKVLNLLITSLDTILCNASEHVRKSGEITLRREQPIEITAEIKGGLSWSQKLAQKENLLKKKTLSPQKSTKASRCSATATAEQQGSKIWQLGH